MKKIRPAHAAMSQFAVEGNHLMIGNMPLIQLANLVGTTPFYAYDRSVIKHQIDLFRHNMPDCIKLHYAIKANPMPALVDFLAEWVDGFDVASIAEMQIALNTGVAANLVSFAGPGKQHTQLVNAISAGVCINLESESELFRILAAGEQLGIRPKIAIRVNPDFELKSAGMKMGGGPQPFGVDAEQVPRLLHQVRDNDVEFIGFHIFSGSQNLNSQAIQECHKLTFDLAIRLAEHYPDPIKNLNIGGGLGIPYFPGENRVDLPAIGENLNALLPNVRDKLGDRTDIIIELGRYLVGEAGVYVTRIVDRKVSRGTTFLVTDGGLHHHLAASGNLGQIIRKNFPITIGNKMDTKEKEEVTVVGPLCTPLDLLGNNVELSKSELGDLIVIFQSGAYGLTASPSRFLSHPEPAELLV